MWLVYKKELLEILRDKKTLIFSILLPTIIFPVLFFGIGKFTQSKTEEAETKELKVAFVNAAAFEGLSTLFTAEKHFKKVEISSSDYKEEILEAISKMSVLEIVDLISAMEENYSSLPGCCQYNREMVIANNN